MRLKYFLEIFWSQAPLSWAIIRASECDLLSKQTFIAPILEVGCGDGLVTKTLFEGKKGYIDVGIDLDSNELRRAKKTGMYQKLLKGDICHSAFATATFNTVFANGVLEHIPDLPLALAQISRILKKNGRLITTSPIDTYTNLLFYQRLFTFLQLPKLAEAYGNFINTKFAHRHLLSVKSWKKLFDQVGLELITFQSCNNPRTTAVHDLFLPLSLGSKTYKDTSDRLALMPSIRKQLQKPLISSLLALTNEESNSGNINSTVLLVAKKK